MNVSNHWMLACMVSAVIASDHWLTYLVAFCVWTGSLSSSFGCVRTLVTVGHCAMLAKRVNVLCLNAQSFVQLR